MCYVGGECGSLRLCVYGQCNPASLQSDQVGFIVSLEFSLMNCLSSTCDTMKRKKMPVLQAIKSRKCPRTLARYISDGAKFCLLAGGGKILESLTKFHYLIAYFLASFFILVIASSANLRSKIRGLTHDMILRINYLLRCPNPRMFRFFIYEIPTKPFPEEPLGKLVIQDIIPAISVLRQQFRFLFSTIFSQELLFSKGVIPEVEAGDFLRSDQFFDSITYK